MTLPSQRPGLTRGAMDRARPWLAGIQMMFAQMPSCNSAADNGVDSRADGMAARDHKQVRYLETIAEQFALLAPDDRALELEEFEAGLKDLRDISAEHPAHGARPGAPAIRRQAGRTDQWRPRPVSARPAKICWTTATSAGCPKIEAMLKEKHVFFVTVGAGHLTGPKGVPPCCARRATAWTAPRRRGASVCPLPLPR